MVAGVKGVAFLDDDTLAVSSSTAGELFLVSRNKREVLKKIPLGAGVKAESLACVPKTRKVLVVDAKGHLCEVDCVSEKVERVASAGHHATPPRLTSVCAWDSKTCFVAGAERGKKTKCACWRVDLDTNKVDEAPVLEANMIRALCAERERDRILIGCLDVEGDDDSPEVENARTRLMAYYPQDGTIKQLASIQGFVHAIAPLHRRKDEAYALLMRHRKGGAPVKVIRLLPKGQHVQVWSKCSVQHTVHVCGDKLATGLAGLSLAGFSASLFGSAAGREHAMCLGPDGRLVTGCVHKSSKGLLQLWNLDVGDRRRKQTSRLTPSTSHAQVAADSDVIAGGTKVPARGSVVDRLPDKTCKA
jgi:hypothetical protein